MSSVIGSSTCPVSLDPVHVQCHWIQYTFSVIGSSTCPVSLDPVHVQCHWIQYMSSVIGSSTCPVSSDPVHVQCHWIQYMSSVIGSSTCPVSLDPVHVQCHWIQYMSSVIGSSTCLVSRHWIQPYAEALTSHFLTVHKATVEYSIVIVLNCYIGQLCTNLQIKGKSSKVSAISSTHSHEYRLPPPWFVL